MGEKLKTNGKKIIRKIWNLYFFGALCIPIADASASTFPLTSPDQAFVGQPAVHKTAKGEVLLDAARHHGFGYTELMAANPGTDPWLSPEGTSIHLPGIHILPDAPRKGIVVNVTAQRLYYFSDDGTQLTSFPIGVGREGRETPLGTTHVVRKQANPTWYPPPSARKDDPSLPATVPPGSDNPLGRHALYLGWPSYLIHGTNKPDGVGRMISNGCVRLYPEDIEHLFNEVEIGTEVRIVEQEAVLAWIGDSLFAQVYPTPEQAREISLRGRFNTPIHSAELVKRAMTLSKLRDGEIDWPAVGRAGLERTGLPVLVAIASSKTNARR